MKITNLRIPNFEPDYSITNLVIISGGQTGSDQAGLKAAKHFRIKTGGWSTKGWRTQDGSQKELLSSYGLKECDSIDYKVRTELNVRDSHITLRFATNFSSAGERCTLNAINKHKRPYVDFFVPNDLTDKNAFITAYYIAINGYDIINIAGNSERTSPGIGRQVEQFVMTMIEELGELSKE